MLVIVVAIVAILLDMIAFVVVFVGVARTQRLLFGGVFRLFAQQRVPVFLRDLIIIGVDFRKGEAAVAVAAILDERRLQRRFNPRHLGAVDITLELPPFSRFNIKFLYTVPVDDTTPGPPRVARA